MDLSHYKQDEPLFGSWTITRWLDTDGCGQIFEIERQDFGVATRAALKAVHIPRKKSEIKAIMPNLQTDAENTACLKAMAEETVHEINILAELKGQSNIIAYEDHTTIELPDKNGLDILIRLELLTPLNDYLQCHMMDEAEVIKLGIDICDALEVCQRHGVIHRAICTDSIFVMPTGDFKLGRFRLACKANTADNTKRLKESHIDTLAPEIYQGDAYNESVDTYALGLVLYQLMNRNRLPFFPPAPQAIDLLQHDQAIGKRISGAPLPKPTQASPAFADVILKACEPNLEKRYNSPAEMRSCLEKLIAPEKTVDTSQIFKNIQEQYAVSEIATNQSEDVLRPAEHESTHKDPAELFQPTKESEAGQGRKKPYKSIATLAGVLACLLLAGFIAIKFVLPSIKDGAILKTENNQGDEGAPSEDIVTPTATPEPTPTLSPEEIEAAAKEERILQATVRTQDICTRTPPEITDPATWAQAGKEVMEKLEQEYADWNFTADVAAYSETAEAGAGINRSSIYSQVGARQDVWSVDFPESYPYLIAVNREASTVTVYTPDEEGRYTNPYMAMACSGGEGTPTGFWFTPIKYQWRTLVGPCYGQYATRIWDSYLFHSVPYYTQNMDDVEYEQYNKLGSYASLGCIRLAVVDVKWIFDNCPIGTPVIIYDDIENPGPMGKPGTIYTDPANEDMRGWDPTDPNPSNPWDEKYRTGTAIRSEAAWADYDAAMESGKWEDTLNETVTQGWSTDATIAGNPG